MGSVAQKACSVCGQEYPDTTGFFRPTGSGVPRSICRSCDKEADRKRWHGRTEPLALIPSNAEHFYDNAQGKYNLTAMWRGAGCPRSKKPNTWLTLPSTVEFLAELNAKEFGIHSARGGAGGTWAHWQVAVEYAGYLSPAFAIQWNEYARAYLEGKTRPVAQAESTAIVPVQDTGDAVEQIKNGIIALFGPAIEQLILSAVSTVLDQRFGAMPQQTAETWETLRGATVIEREVRTEVHHEWVLNGHCYLAVDVANNRLAIGETNKEPARRLEDSDYNGGKSGGTWVLAYSFATDDRKAAEQDLIRLARNAGAIPITGTRGTFVYERRIEQDFKQLPARIKYENLRRWVAQARLFEAPMFIYDQ